MVVEQFISSSSCFATRISFMCMYTFSCGLVVLSVFIVFVTFRSVFQHSLAVLSTYVHYLFQKCCMYRHSLAVLSMFIVTCRSIVRHSLVVLSMFIVTCRSIGSCWHRWNEDTGLVKNFEWKMINGQQRTWIWWKLFISINDCP